MSNDTNSLIGRMIGKYKVESMLGRGGMAEVYKAYQANLERHVAIKLMYPFMSADENFVSRFKREALTMARIDHPNIVRVYDFDVQDFRYYIVMQYIQGGTLKEKIEASLAQGQLVPLADTVQIMLEMADALAYAHSYGMVHRDIKPGNIMLNDDGRAILTDFGIAKMTSGTQYTATGAMVGTPAYMSPEQGLGKSGDERSDLYALGVLFYNLVTGQLPHEADTPIALLLKHVNEAPLEPTSLNPNLPTEVENVVYRLLEKEPEDRYQTAKDFARELRTAVRNLKASDMSAVAAVPSSALEDKPTPPPVSTFPSPGEVTEIYDITPAGGVRNPAMASTQVNSGAGGTVAGGGYGATQVGLGQSATPLPSEPLPKDSAKKRGVPVWLYLLGFLVLLGGGGFAALSSMGMLGGNDTPVVAEVTEEPTAVVDDAATQSAAVSAQVQLTLDASSTETAATRQSEIDAEATEEAEEAAVEAATETAVAEASSNEADEATETPTPTATPTDDAPQAITDESSCTYDAEVVEIYTYNSPDNRTTAPANAGLTLNWVLRNTGDCPWPADTALENTYGEDFGQDDPVLVSEIPVPGEEVTIRVERLKAPANAGQYDSAWLLVNEDGSISIGEEITFLLGVYSNATETPVPTNTPEPTIAAETGGGTDSGGGDEPVNFNFDFSNCTYPGGGIEYECRLAIVPYGGPSGTYTVWVFDADQPAEYQQRSGSITHFFSARRCAVWVHTVKVQNNQSGEEVTQDLYFDPTSRALFPDGTCTE